MKIENRKHWLSDIVGAIPDNKLCAVIEENNEFRMTGVLPEGAVKLKDLSRQAADICKVNYGEMMRTVEDAVLFEAAWRYHNHYVEKAKKDYSAFGNTSTYEKKVIDRLRNDGFTDPEIKRFLCEM